MALVFDGAENQFTDPQPSDLTPKQSDMDGSQPLTPCEQVLKQFLTENLTLELLYRLSVQFYREKESKAFSVSYNDRTKLFAYNKIVKHGSYKEFLNSQSNGDGVGFFDWIGNDLRDCWEDLGDMSKEEAKSRFILLLSSLCPLFSTFVEAQGRKIDEETRMQKAEAELKAKSESQRNQIQEALNAQTYHQFKAYAQQQYPDDIEQQNGLIKHLQEQHYVQYVQQVYQQQQHVSNVTAVNSNGECIKDDSSAGPINNESEPESSEDGSEPPVDSAVTPASIWTRKDITEFKEFVKKESPESCIKVSYGEVITVRVPTHEDGTSLFWEFATDDYDIGFGLFFEWTLSDTNTVSVHVSESDEEEENELAAQKKGDVEVGQPEKDAQICKPQIDEILPVYRRDCHEEVYAGSHAYPGRGVYLLKFDNSYSLWRSKRLYYRVYYSK